MPETSTLIAAMAASIVLATILAKIIDKAFDFIVTRRRVDEVTGRTERDIRERAEISVSLKDLKEKVGSTHASVNELRGMVLGYDRHVAVMDEKLREAERRLDGMGRRLEALEAERREGRQGS